MIGYRKMFLVLALLSQVAWSESTVLVPEGEFKHPVLLDRDIQTEQVEAFTIDRNPVSRSDFATFLLNYNKWRRSEIPGIYHDGGYLRDWASDLDPGDSPASAVTRVSWYAARAYCDEQGGYLPGLVQWEYFLALLKERNGLSDDDYASAVFAWFGEQADSGFVDHHFGTTGMIGVVNEWLEDYQLMLSNGEKIDFGGGSCGDTARLMAKYDQVHYATFLRYQARSNYSPSTTTSNLGFRCAYDAE